MRGKLAFLWLGQLVLPGSVVLIALRRAIGGRAPDDWLWLTAGGAVLWIVAAFIILLASRAKGRLLLRTGFSLWMTAVVWSLAMGALKLTHVRVDLAMTVWRARQVLAGRSVEGKEIGLFTAHSRYGWWHLPRAIGQHEYVDFDVAYTTDEECFRATRTPEKPLGEVLCLGCSFTFGHGVSDHEPYAAVLADRYWINFKVHNTAVNGWGTAQALLLTQDYFASHPAPSLVMYGWIAKHAERNALRKRWLEFLAKSDRKNPYFEMESDSLVFRGLRGPEDGLPDSPTMDATEVDLSVHMLHELGRICQEHGTRFLVVLLPYASKAASYNRQLDSLTDEVAAGARKAGLECLDVRQCTAGLARDTLYFEHDPHPKPLWHELIAKGVADQVVPTQKK